MKTEQEITDQFNDFRRLFLDILQLAKKLLIQIDRKDCSISSYEPDIIGVMLYTRILTACDSIRKIIPKSINDKYLDCNSILTLTRNIIETAEILFYICSDTNNINKKILRIKHLELCDIANWTRKYTHLNKEHDASEFEKIEKLIVKEIKSNPIYLKLSEKQKKGYINSKIKFIEYDREELEKKMGYLNPATSVLTYFIYSAAAHSEISSFHYNDRNYNTRGSLIHDLEHISNGLFISSIYLAFSAKILINNVIKNIAYVYKQYSEHEKKILSEIFFRLDSFTKYSKV